jgi:hypothetical protein
MRYYVYELTDAQGVVQYVGKGSGTRLRAQIRNFRLLGHEVARFKRESDAYAYERQRIAEVKPLLNKCAGGNGSRATPVRAPRKTAWEKEVDRVGSRVYAARLLLSFRNGINSLVSKVEMDWAAIEAVAYGSRT